MKKTKFKDGGFLTKKSLNKIKQEVSKRKLIIYGNSGVGKKTWCNSSDKIFIATKRKENEENARKNN